MSIQKKISELTAKTGVLEDTDVMVISDYNGSTYDTKKITGSQIVPFKTFICVLNQSGTSAPTATGGYSDFSGALTFTRTAVGTYLITNSVSEFTTNKTFVFIQGGTGVTIRFYQYQIISNSQIYIYTFDNLGVAADGLITNNSFEIKIIK